VVNTSRLIDSFVPYRTTPANDESTTTPVIDISDISTEISDEIGAASTRVAI